MSDLTREEVIETLSDIDRSWRSFTDKEYKALDFAIDSLKTDASDKTDRGEAITTLTEHLNHWKRLLSEGVCTKDEGERTINALTFAIESIKVDRAYDLAYEKVDFIEIPEGVTNGNMLISLYPNLKYTIQNGRVVTTIGVASSFDLVWWNSPYRKGR